jgi:parallel beta helix pectate lyase-like protein
VKPHFFLAFLCVFALLASLSLFAAPVRAAPSSNYIVNFSDDLGDAIPGDNHCETIPTNGHCTLRAAIQEASAHAGSDSISFGITGTITLGSRLPPITDTLAIDGPGEANLTISGNNLVGVMQVNSGATVTLSGVTVANGNATQGAGIQISGTLTISSTTFRANAAGTGGAIYNDGGTAALVNSTFYSNTAAGDGGVIKNINSAVTTVTNTTIYSNTAGGGGVVWNDSSGSVTISNSNVYSNTANTSGMIYNASKVNIANSSFYSNTGINAGVIYNDLSGITTISSSVFYTNTGGAGGVLVINSGTLVITNSTFYDNRGINNSGVGFISASGAMTISNSTLNGNHAPIAAGIWNNSSSVSLRNTIVAFNSPGTNCYGIVVTSLGYNLENANDCLFTGTGDLVNTNPLLASLANNGGPTKTMALFPGSQAMNQIPPGTNGCGTYITTDQRGVARPQGPTSACDIGAYEYDGAIYPLYLPLIMK